MLFVCENNQYATEVPFAYAAGNPSVAGARRGLRHAGRRGGRQRRAGGPRGGRRGGPPRPARATGRRCSSARPTAPAPHAEGMGDFGYRTARRGRGVEDALPDRRGCKRLLLPSGRPGRAPRTARASTRRSRPRSRTPTQFAESSPWPDPATATDSRLCEPAERPEDGDADARAHLHAGHARSAWPRRWRATRRSSSWAKASASAAATSSTTAGLFDRYGPERLRDTPICERGFVGLARGAAMTGTRPVVDFMFVDFVLDARRRDHQPDRQDAVHEQRPAEDADRAARLHRHRPLGGDAPLRQLLPDATRTSPACAWSCRRRPPTPRGCSRRRSARDDPVLFLEHRECWH